MKNHVLAALFAAALSASCLPAHASDIDELKQAAEWGKLVMGDKCDFPEFESGEDILENNRIHKIEFKYRYEPETDAPHIFSFYELHCTSGAYNVVNIYVARLHNNKYELLSFAEPNLDISYDDDEGMMTRLKGAPKVVGWRATTTLVNSSFDPATRTITSRPNWRGLGDAWSSGTWTFEYGEFILTGYDVDPVYDLNAADARQGEERPQDIFRILP